MVCHNMLDVFTLYLFCGNYGELNLNLKKVLSRLVVFTCVVTLLHVLCSNSHRNISISCSEVPHSTGTLGTELRFISTYRPIEKDLNGKLE